MLAVLVLVAGLFSPSSTVLSNDDVPWFYRQTLRWESCLRYGPFGGQAQCTRLVVPLDYARPTGPRVSLGVLRYPAKQTNERIGSLIFNPGGPGASGMTVVDNTRLRPAIEPLSDRFDIVGFDARGTGASRPRIDCVSTRARDALHSLPIEPSTEELVAIGRRIAGDCASDTDLLAHVGTREVVRDMDVLRVVLGDEKLTYYGRSYATRVGATYAKTFPGHVRAMVLDGALHPSAPMIDQTRAQLGSLHDALAGFITYCTKRLSCPLGADPTAASGQLDALIARAPFPVDNRQLSGWEIAYVIGANLYDSMAWPQLFDLLANLVHGRPREVLNMADRVFGRQLDGTYAAGITEVPIAVNCVDAAFPPHPAATLADLRRAAGPNEPWRLALLSDPYVTCPYWPVPVTVDPSIDTTGLPTLLVVSTTGDNITPYANGVALADNLNAHLLTYQGYRHTAYLAGNDCVNNTINGYLINPQIPPENTYCR